MKQRENKLKAIFYSFTREKIFIFFCFILPPLILYFIEVTNTVLILYQGGITSVSAIAYLLITRTSIGTLGISYKRAIAKIITQTIVIAAVTIFILAIIPWINHSPRTIYWRIDPLWYLSIVIYQEII